MNSREKLLALGFGGIVSVLGVQYGITAVREGFDAKQRRIESLQNEIELQIDTVDQGMIASENFGAVVGNSLPSDLKSAQLVYKEWLGDLVARHRLEASAVRFDARLRTNDVYSLLQFSLNCNANIEQLTKLLGDFYRKNYLHRVKKLTLTRLSGEPYLMKVSCELEVLALSSAAPDQLPPDIDSQRLAMPVDEYVQSIVSRNVLAPANQSPEFEGSSRLAAFNGKSMKEKLVAKNPEEYQELAFTLVGEAPDGLEISSAGEVSWNAKENGEFEFTARVTDDGLPSRSSEKTFRVVVSDPPKPPEPVVEESFDVAQQAFVTAFLNGKRGPEVWVNSRLEDKTLHLNAGDNFKVGEIAGKVISVGSTYVEIETEEKRWLIGMDESVADAYRRTLID